MENNKTNKTHEKTQLSFHDIQMAAQDAIKLAKKNGMGMAYSALIFGGTILPEIRLIDDGWGGTP